jgi:hypothetical protein
MRRGRSRYQPATRRFWRRWSSFGVRLWSYWGRVEMVADVMKLNEKLEATNAANVAGILGA